MPPPEPCPCPSPPQFATKFHYSRTGPLAEKLTHHTTMEVIWTVFPTLVVLFIGIPSLTLIYSMDQHTDKPGTGEMTYGRGGGRTH
jgi:heme/copper-type cytochrome/quinol oxidase subunit 2